MATRSKLLDPASIPLKQRARDNIWSLLIQLTKILLVVGALAVLAAYFAPVVQRSRKLQSERTSNETKIQSALEENVRLEQEVFLLKTNPEYIERQSRDRLNVAKPNEIIFRFDPYQPAASPAPGQKTTAP